MSWQEDFVRDLIADYQFSSYLYKKEKEHSLEAFYSAHEMEYARENLKYLQRILLRLPKRLVKKYCIAEDDWT